MGWVFLNTSGTVGHAAPCDHPGCIDPATCTPIVLVRARVHVEKPAHFKEGFRAEVHGNDKYILRYKVLLNVCDRHQSAFSLRKYVMDWDAIENQLRCLGMAPPNRNLTRVEWEAAPDECGLLIA